MDDQVGGRQKFAGVEVKPSEQIEFGVSKPAAGVEETREPVEVEVQPAVGQRGTRVKSQSPLLFRTQEQEVDLVGEGVARVLFEQRLKGTFGMAFEAEGEIAAGGKRADKAGLAHAARTDDGNDVCHLRQL